MERTANDGPEMCPEERIYAEESFVIDVNERICESMESRGVSRAELARRLGTSGPWITKMLRGTNVSVRTLAAVAHALGGVADFRIVTPEAAAGRRPGARTLRRRPPK